MLPTSDRMQVSTPASAHPTCTPSSYTVGPQAIKSTYAYRVEQARVALSQAQEHLAALLSEQPSYGDSLQVLFPATLHPTRPSSSYEIGPMDASQLILMQAHCSGGEVCPLLTPAHLPLWILNHPDFRDGYEMNYFVEEEGGDEEWSSVSHLVNQVYSNLLGEGFEDPVSGELRPDFGIWEIGWLLRDFTRLAEADRTLALTGIAHLWFLISFLPEAQPSSWPPVGLIEAQGAHNTAVKAYLARLRGYRNEGKSYAEAERLALVQRSGSEGEPHDPVQATTPVTLLALLEHPEFREGLRDGQETFLGDYEPKPLTEEEMIEKVEINLSRRIIERCNKLCRLYGDEPISYLYNLGHVVGTIDKGLSYAGANPTREEAEC